MTALGSSAVGLGRVQGTAWIGKPLSVTIPVRLEIPEEPSALCPEVEVFLGDSRVNPERVTVVVGGRNPREPVLQIRAAAVVDEPVVTLYVRVGCTNKSSRRYLLLAEPEPEPENAGFSPPSVVPPVVGPVVPTRPGVAGAIGAAGDGGASSESRVARSVSDPAASRQPANRTVGRDVVRRSDPTQPIKDEPKPRAVVRVPEAAPPKMLLGKSRLKLDPVELFVERDPVLRPTRELSVVPAEVDPRRSEMAALWKALNQSPEDILKTEQRLVSMQTTLSTIESQHRQQSRLVADLRAELERAKATNSRSQLALAAMGFLTVLAALIAGFVWYRARKRSESAWWNVDEDNSLKDDPELPVVAARTEDVAQARAAGNRVAELASGKEVGTTPLVVSPAPTDSTPSSETLQVLGADRKSVV